MLGVLTLVYFGLQRVGGMSDRFFASTLDGANGLVRYLVGDYIGAARAYRSHHGYYVAGQGPGARRTPPENASANYSRIFRRA